MIEISTIIIGALVITIAVLIFLLLSKKKKQTDISQLRQRLYENYETAIKKIAQDYQDMFQFLKELERR